MENLEDAVALFSPEGELMFSNAAMRALLPGLGARTGRPARRSRPCRSLPRTIPSGNWSNARSPDGSPPGPSRCRSGRRQKRIRKRRNICSCATRSTMRRDGFIGAMVVARNLGLPHPGPHDAQLFAQARRARPPDGRRRARGEESAQRDDHPPRAAQAEARSDARADHRPRRALRGLADARPDQARQRHRRRDQAARPGRRGIPEVRPARRAEAAARAPLVARQRSDVDDRPRSRAAGDRRSRRSARRACRRSTPTPGCCSRRC